MEPRQFAELKDRATGKNVPVWALALTAQARNLPRWQAITTGSDVGVFYTDKRFTYKAKIISKWHSDELQDIVGWKPRPDGARYSLAIALEPVEECNFGAAEYCALLGYDRVPMHTDIHGEEDSRELFEALRTGFQLNRGDGDREYDGDFEVEGGPVYRVQLLRERSDGNRLRILDVRGHVCEVCGFDFVAQFGKDFAPSAHVHHKEPLMLGIRRETSAEAFAVLCGPCHTAAHMGQGRKLIPWTVEELRSRIAVPWPHPGKH